MEERNAREYQKVAFVRKQDLRAAGSQTASATDVEEADGFPGRDGKPARKELVLVLSDRRSSRCGRAPT